MCRPKRGEIEQLYTTLAKVLLGEAEQSRGSGQIYLPGLLRQHRDFRHGSPITEPIIYGDGVTEPWSERKCCSCGILRCSAEYASRTQRFPARLIWIGGAEELDEGI